MQHNWAHGDESNADNTPRDTITKSIHKMYIRVHLICETKHTHFKVGSYANLIPLMILTDNKIQKDKQKVFRFEYKIMKSKRNN